MKLYFLGIAALLGALLGPGGQTPSLAQTEDLRRTPVVRAVEQASPAVVNVQASKVYERDMNPCRDLSRNSG